MAGGENGLAIVPGKLDESLLWERISADEMPPEAPLPSTEKSVIRDWIAAGARWGTDPLDPFQVTTARRAGRDWWSLQPVKRPSPPVTANLQWPRGPIDDFVLARLEAAGFSPAPEADKRSLARRLSFDLLGLPPAPEAVDAFLADTSPRAYERLVDGFLASPHYGVRWARWWLDLARYGESNGFEFDEFRPNAWRYRDWVASALNRDVPYDEFARLQLAGDVLRPTDAAAVTAAGFLVAGPYDTTGQNQQSQAMKAVVRGDELEDLIGTVGQTFLGLTLNCARCHDHKFDPVRQVEYYALASALAGVRHGERDVSTIDPEARLLRARIQETVARIGAIEQPARTKIAALRKQSPRPAPVPLAAWDFDRSLDDLQGGRPVELHGTAALTPQGLSLDGTSGYASTPPLSKQLSAKTLEVWVRLKSLDQRGGGALGIQSSGGAVFDAIVYGEQQPGRWMAGSDNFRRSQSANGEAETEAAQRAVHIAIAYSPDGTIQVFRNGRPYGEAYRSSGPVVFPAGGAQVYFGLRHAPAGGNRLLAGTVVRARLYDRALDLAEIAASAESSGDAIDPAALAALLSPDRRAIHAKLQSTLESLRASLAERSKAYTVTPREPGVMRVHMRGNPNQLGDAVKPGGVPAVMAPGASFGLAPDAPEARRRLELAGWICNPRNPLFTRVLVNRIWQAHFGVGLVETPSDLGWNGGRSSHQELLDWLASELVAQRFSLKSMHRMIVTSAAYRQSSAADTLAMKQDALDRLLWRKAPVRLEAEMVRDAMLAISGALDIKMGGPSFRDQRITQAPGTPAILYVPVDPRTPGLNRRTLYRLWARGGRSSLLDAFDCPDPSTSAPRRAVTTTPLQALVLLNNALVLFLSDEFADRLAREIGPDPHQQVERAFRLAFARGPDPDEQTRACRVVQQFGLSALTRAIFNSNEFLYLD
jgi:hypothetical protein